MQIFAIVCLVQCSAHPPLPPPSPAELGLTCCVSEKAGWQAGRQGREGREGREGSRSVAKDLLVGQCTFRACGVAGREREQAQLSTCTFTPPLCNLHLNINTKPSQAGRADLPGIYDQLWSLLFISLLESRDDFTMSKIQYISQSNSRLKLLKTNTTLSLNLLITAGLPLPALAIVDPRDRIIFPLNNHSNSLV